MQTLRTVAWVFIALALVFIGADIISSAELGRPEIRTTREIVNLLPGLQIGIPQGGGPAKAAALFLDLPLWAITGVIGFVATVLVRPVE
jgi:hypothetical protein